MALMNNSDGARSVSTEMLLEIQTEHAPSLQGRIILYLTSLTSAANLRAQTS